MQENDDPNAREIHMNEHVKYRWSETKVTIVYADQWNAPLCYWNNQESITQNQNNPYTVECSPMERRFHNNTIILDYAP